MASCFASTRPPEGLSRIWFRTRPGAHKRAFEIALAAAVVTGPASAMTLIFVNVQADRSPATAFTGTVSAIGYRKNRASFICASRGELNVCCGLRGSRRLGDTLSLLGKYDPRAGRYDPRGD